MSRRNIFIVLLVMLSIIAGFQNSCSDKALNQPEVTSAVMVFDMSAKASFSQGEVDNFRIVVYPAPRLPDNSNTYTSLSDTIVDSTIEFIGDTVAFKLDDLPADEPLIFVSQVIMSSTGAVIYYGATTAILSSDNITNISIDLFPAVPMVKLSPRYIEIGAGQNSSFELKVNGIRDLSQLSFRLSNDYSDQISFTTQVTTELSDRVFVLDTVSSSYYACVLDNSERTNSIVGFSGNGTLATISFTSPTIEIQQLPDTVTFSIDSLVMYDTEGSLIDANSVYGNQAWLVITDEVVEDTISPAVVIDIDGNVYQTITIGSQVWMAENLKVTRYRNGDTIQQETDSSIWSSLTTGAYCVNNNDSFNVATYGLLYNWYAVNENRNIAPEGWHIPSDEEWKQLEVYLGMSQIEVDDVGFRGTDEGGKLKDTLVWNTPNEGATNEYGFSGLPGSYRSDNGGYYYVGADTHIWSSTEEDSLKAWYRYLDYSSSAIHRGPNFKTHGFSVRCVKN